MKTGRGRGTRTTLQGVPHHRGTKRERPTMVISTDDTRKRRPKHTRRQKQRVTRYGPSLSRSSTSSTNKPQHSWTWDRRSPGGQNGGVVVVRSLDQRGVRPVTSPSGDVDRPGVADTKGPPHHWKGAVWTPTGRHDRNDKEGSRIGCTHLLYTRGGNTHNKNYRTLATGPHTRSK